MKAFVYRAGEKKTPVTLTLCLDQKVAEGKIYCYRVVELESGEWRVESRSDDEKKWNN